MKTLLKNGFVVNVFTDEIEKTNVLIEDDRIIGIGAYTEDEADITEDVTGKYICPGFIDGHIHIESTMLTPPEFAKAVLLHGTTAVMADPHEIANVAGTNGIHYMLKASKKLPLDVYIMLPSCVPASPFDESGAVLEAEDLFAFYADPKVLGLGEVMNFPGVLAGDFDVMCKIEDARAYGKAVSGHAPMLNKKELDRYIAAGIGDDHECTTLDEALERIRKGQMVMIRQGTAARNLHALLPLFDAPYNRRCMLVTDDRHPADLLSEGHIDHIIRLAAASGKSPVTAIRMASLQAASYFGLRDVGAVAPGYRADLLVLDDLKSVKVRDVYKNGRCIVKNGELTDAGSFTVPQAITDTVRGSFHIKELTAEDFFIEPQGGSCRVIRLIPNELLTDEWVTTLDFSKNNGVDIARDIVKLAVLERHNNTGHKGLGYIAGVGLKNGAIASSVSHDSHNLIVIGTNDADMAAAANRIRELGGGNVVVSDGKVLAEMPLPVGGLMSELTAAEAAAQNEAVRAAVHRIGAPGDIEPFMNMAFISLPVIPALKMTTNGLIDVIRHEPVSLFVKKQLPEGDLR